MKTTTVLAQLSDLHICKPNALAYGRLDTARHLNDALELLYLRELGIDALVITGDLVDFENPVEYRHLVALLESVRIPTLLLPGNHDHRATMREVLSRHTYLGSSGFIQYSARIGGLRLIALDSVDDESGGGRLCRE